MTNPLRPPRKAYSMSREAARKYDRTVRLDPEAQRFIKEPSKAALFRLLMDQPSDPLMEPLIKRFRRHQKATGFWLPF